MVLTYILTAVGVCLGVLLLIVAICAVLANPRKLLAKQSRGYWVLLNGCAAILLRLMRIRVHTKGEQKLHDRKKLLVVAKPSSKLELLIIGYAFGSWNCILQSPDDDLSYVQDADVPIAVTAISEMESLPNRFPSFSMDVYVNILEVIPAESVRNADTETLRVAVKHILSNAEKR